MIFKIGPVEKLPQQVDYRWSFMIWIGWFTIWFHRADRWKIRTINNTWNVWWHEWAWFSVRWMPMKTVRSDR